MDACLVLVPKTRTRVLVSARMEQSTTIPIWPPIQAFRRIRHNFTFPTSPFTDVTRHQTMQHTRYPNLDPKPHLNCMHNTRIKYFETISVQIRGYACLALQLSETISYREEPYTGNEEHNQHHIDAMHNHMNGMSS